MIEIAPRTYHPIHRQNGSNSQQPRFNTVSPTQFFRSIFRFATMDIHDEPEYGDRRRDRWLARVWKQEPYLAGVINSVTQIDKSRRWSLIGGRNQVKRFVDVLHNRFFFAPDLSGWRAGFAGSALSYYVTDLGSLTEIGRLNGPQGPLDSLYFLDPTKCYLTGSSEEPLAYTPPGGKTQKWALDDYFRVTSMPDITEDSYGNGFCALSRCIELAKIMVGVYQYDNEMLLNKAPRGLLLLKGITEDQWADSLAAREARLQSKDHQYYGGVEALASIDPGVEIDAKIVALSQLPAEFDQETFTNLLLYGYALIFGYDPREFWPVSGGQLGSGRETETQHRKAGGKGGLDFVLGFQQKVQEELPDTLQFEFEERDLDGELAEAEAQQGQATVIKTMYEGGIQLGTGLLSREEARILLAERQLINPDWTENEEQTVATDTDDDISRSERVQRAIWKYQNEPIVRYTYPDNKYRVLVPARRKLRTRSYFFIKRQQDEFDEELEAYQNRLQELMALAEDGAITPDEAQDWLDGLTIAILIRASLYNKLQNEAQQVLLDASRDILLTDDLEILREAMITLNDIRILREAFASGELALLSNDIHFDKTLVEDVTNGRYDNDKHRLLVRLSAQSVAVSSLFHTMRNNVG